MASYSAAEVLSYFPDILVFQSELPMTRQIIGYVHLSWLASGYTITLRRRYMEKELEMWANAKRDGHPAEYRWRPLFNTAKFG